MHRQLEHFLHELAIARQLRAQRQIHACRRAAIDRIATVIVSCICLSAFGFLAIGIAAVVRWVS